MDQELLEERYRQALRTIEQFGPEPQKDHRPETDRLDLLRWALDNRNELQKATKQELAAIVAIIESCQRR